MMQNIRLRHAASAILLALAFASTVRGQWTEDSIDVGGAWVGSLAYNPLMDVVYGNCQYLDGVFFAIDCATNTIAETWPIQWPRDCVYDSIDHKAYMTFGYYAESLAVIDGRTHQRIKAMPLARANQCVWDGMRDKLYVSCGPRDVVAVFDCTRDSLICEIPVGLCPIGMSLSGRRRKLYVQNSDDNTVSVIDLFARAEIARIDIGYYCGTGYYSATADGYYCGYELENGQMGVAIIDGASDSLRARLPILPGIGGPRAFAENADLGIVLVGWDDYPQSQLAVLDAHGDSLLGLLALDEDPMAFVRGAGADGYYLACTDGDDVVFVSPDGMHLRSTLPVGNAPFCFANSVRSHRLYVGLLGSHRVYVIRDEVGGIAENGSSRLPRGAAAVVRGILETDAPGLLLDVSGRAVMRLLRGVNDVRQLAPGVYAVATARGVTGRVVKVR